jgi:chondroitin sulfate synthase
MLRLSNTVVGRRTARSAFLSIIGIICGISTILFIQIATNTFSFTNPVLSCPEALTSSKSTKHHSELVIIGIMTAAKYVDTRAYNVWKTWAQRNPGKVLFFVAEDTYSEHDDMPLIRLKGVDDVYPPQKKSFAMMRWLSDNYLEDFDWFIRADDDLYIRGEQLETFLRSLDPTKPHFLGQAGLGNTAEYGQLSLGQRDNYCMGGPGIVFSRETLRMLAPHLESCLLEMLTTHEDVELGRCVRKHVGIACSWNYEMQTLFHNNQSNPSAFKGWGTNPELMHAVTLHPIKQPEHMRKVHQDNLITRLRELRSMRIKLEQAKTTSKPVLLVRRVANTTNDLSHWDYTALNKITFCANGINCPRHTIDSNMKNALGDIVTDLFDEFNSNARHRGRILQFQSIQYAYSRVEPRHGVDYVLDIILWFKKFRPPHRATLSVRRHAYVQQTFGEIEAITDEEHVRILKSASTYYTNMTDDEQQETALNSKDSKRVHLLMPLRGRSTTFKRFCENMLEVLPPSEKDIELVLILYKSDNEIDDVSIRKEAQALSAVLDVRIVDMGDSEFSRGKALTTGSKAMSPDSLMFFTDVDMLFTYGTIERIRTNTILGTQVYFPIVFSEFAPESWSANDESSTSHFSYGRTKGYFRHFGFGLVSLYRRDFDAVGGFNLTIRGWGMEDVDLFEKVISSHLRVLRAPEPGLVHVYHSIYCSSDMPEQQRKMCTGSKAQSLASLDFLAEKILPFSA